ncbi:MAG: cell wall biosynthesis glycosyltransferase [Candidatus Bathyarchaeota archaeon]|nr:cell wall biosynthesis glycosyltransferase [Candidatus Bathyarchaeota archaeon]
MACCDPSCESALSLDARVYLHDIEKADILVGIPSFNNVLTASYVLSQVVKGLDTYFPNMRSVIFVSDGNSTDQTLTSVKKVNLPSAVKLIPAIYMGLSGKGRAIRAIFEAASYLKVKSVALVDSDLRSITPEWMRLLISPALAGTGFVAPYYNRRKYDGTITNFLCYPVITSLFGKDIRQPIGGDFGLSIELVEDLLASPMWKHPDVCRFGIDIFETITAVAKDYKIKQALLGVKNHDAKDPTSQLASMFRQVMNVMFTCIEQYESVWKEISGVVPTQMFGEAIYSETPEPIQVSLPATVQAFKDNYDKHRPIYKSFLDQEIQNAFEQIKEIENKKVDFSSEIWAKTVYSFIAEFHKQKANGREKLLDALRILWIGRVAVFLKDTWTLSREECEQLITTEAKVFQKLKPYLIERY